MEGKDAPKIYINEINAIPGSLSFYLWEATGVSFSGLMDRLVAGALKRDRAASHKTVSYPANIFSMGRSTVSGPKNPGPGSETATKGPAGVPTGVKTNGADSTSAPVLHQTKINLYLIKGFTFI